MAGPGAHFLAGMVLALGLALAGAGCQFTVPGVEVDAVSDDGGGGAAAPCDLKSVDGGAGDLAPRDGGDVPEPTRAGLLASGC